MGKCEKFIQLCSWDVELTCPELCNFLGLDPVNEGYRHASADLSAVPSSYKRIGSLGRWRPRFCLCHASTRGECMKTDFPDLMQWIGWFKMAIAPPARRL